VLPAAFLLAAALAPAAEASPRPVAGDPRVVQALRVLEAWADAQQAYQQVPGVSLAVVHDQQLLWARGFGYAHPDRKAAATPQTMYSICSISKLFTSVAVLQQRDAGRVRLDDPVEKHLPWFRLAQTPPGSGPITIRGILTHSSGLPRESDSPYWTGPDYPFPTREKVIEQVKSQAALYPADTFFQYSNLGLTLAGEVAAAAAGRPYGDYVRSAILDPLGLKDTEVEHQDRHRGGRLATGFSGPRRDGSRQPVSAYQVRGIGPAAGFTSTVEDLARFASWQFRLLDKGGTEVLSANTLREMQRVQWMDPDWKTTYGLGFAIWRNGDKTFVGHGGFCPGYQSQLLLQTDAKVATIFMTNTNGVNSRQWAQTAYEVVAPAIAQAVKEPAGAKAPDPSLARYEGRYESWTSGEIHVLPWEDGLALLLMPVGDPAKDLVKLKPEGEHRFRRKRDDGSLGEELRFEVGPDGVPTRLWWNSNSVTRAR
jgi:CubicO group peptidase (beta-lactamase class C family)